MIMYLSLYTASVGVRRRWFDERLIVQYVVRDHMMFVNAVVVLLLRSLAVQVPQGCLLAGGRSIW